MAHDREETHGANTCDLNAASSMCRLAIPQLMLIICEVYTETS